MNEALQKIIFDQSPINLMSLRDFIKSLYYEKEDEVKDFLKKYDINKLEGKLGCEWIGEVGKAGAYCGVFLLVHGLELEFEFLEYLKERSLEEVKEKFSRIEKSRLEELSEREEKCLHITRIFG
jgi:hypothetical protein